MRLTIEQAKAIVVDVRRANPNIIAGFALLTKDQYTTANELYSAVGDLFDRSIAELRDKQIISPTTGGFGQDFQSYGFPYSIPNFDHLDVIFCYIDRTANIFRWKCIFRYITNDEVEYATTLRIAYIPKNKRTN